MGQKSMYPAIQISTRKVDIATITSNKKKKKKPPLGRGNISPFALFPALRRASTDDFVMYNSIQIRDRKKCFSHPSGGPRSQLLTWLRPCGLYDVFVSLRRLRNVFHSLQLHSRMLSNVSFDFIFP
jgi:hypothetical protein